MKLIITGGRYTLTAADYRRLEAIPLVTEVVSGGALGVETAGEIWACRAGLLWKVFPTLRQVHGKRAGPIRNTAMAQYADAVALFPGGKGTRSMARIAQAHRLRIYDFREAAV